MPNEGLHETVARTARLRPGAVALVAGDRRVTYAELDRVADAWAAGLAAAGAGTGTFVPIVMPRSVELVVALLATLKTGAAYALLDPAWPRERVEEVLDDLSAELVVAPPGTGSGPIPVWSPPAHGATAPPDFRPAAVDGSHPCCVFFTSGTTGRPKGAVTPHRATARLFGRGTFARFGPDTVMPLAAPAPWDAFSLELWSVLLNGGTSVVIDDPYLSAHSLRAGVSRHGVNCVWLTSSLFNMIVDEDLDAFVGVGQVMTGGERLSPAHVERFLARHPGIALLNGYGPVESTVFATTHRIEPEDCARERGIPLGRPVPGTSVHVLDGDRECAVGETGEICIGGDGLALRYLGDPALTAAKFTPIPLGDGPERVYRTGDLGAWGCDGRLRFRGRRDRQLKIRGHRVEPAEVERQVERLLPSVRCCRVVAREGRFGGQELVAFCIPADGEDALADAGAALRSGLVAHHVPAAVVSVTSFPVTAQGKLDETALLRLAPPVSPATATAAPAAARSVDPTTSLVAETFCEVLGQPAVPHDVTFFDLGGGSLAAGRVCARLAGRLSRPVPVSRLYEHPTVDALARWLRSAATDAIAPEPTGADGVPLTPMQLVFLTRHLVDPSDRTGHCRLVWSVDGEVDLDALDDAVAAVHERHEPLRAAYVADPRPAAQLVDVPPPLPEVLDEQPSIEAAVRALSAELGSGLEPAAGEAWRTAFVPAGDGASVFGCVVHHIAFDGWSQSVLARDLGRAYAAALGAATGDAPPPPSLEEAHRERAARLRHADLGPHTDYLLAELADVPPLRWPGPPPDGGPRAPRLVEAWVSPAGVAAVDAVAAAGRTTRFAVLLSRWAAAVADVTGQDDFAVGVPVAQRHDVRLEHAVGCHINTVCIRLRGEALEGGERGLEATARAAGRALAAQDVAFPDLLQLAAPRRTNRPPLFQTLFALQDNALPCLGLSGLHTRFLRQPYLDLPLELHAELWPDEDGGIRVEVSFRPDAVAAARAEELAARFAARLPAGRRGARL